MVSDAQRRANEKYYNETKKSIDQIRIRAPLGYQIKLQDYVAKMAAKYPDSEKYTVQTGRYRRPSVNQWLLTLIDEEFVRNPTD